MPIPIIGIMGPGEDATNSDIAVAYKLGAEVAHKRWIVLTGGRSEGVMDAACRGAHSAGGITIGILPGQNLAGSSSYLDIPIITGLGEARNIINILSSDVVVSVGMNPGTASEISLAIKARKSIFLLNCPPAAEAFFSELGKGTVRSASSFQEVIKFIENIIS